MSARYNRRGVTLIDLNVARISQRAAAMQQVHALLEEKELSSSAIAAQLGMNPQTAYGYLRQLEDEGYVCKTGQVDAGGRQTWAQDNAPEKQADDHAQRARIVKAEQVGMWRDPMIAAFWGPAPGVAA